MPWCSGRAVPHTPLKSSSRLGCWRWPEVTPPPVRNCAAYFGFEILRVQVLVGLRVVSVVEGVKGKGKGKGTEKTALAAISGSFGARCNRDASAASGRLMVKSSEWDVPLNQALEPCVRVSGTQLRPPPCVRARGPFTEGLNLYVHPLVRRGLVARASAIGVCTRCGAGCLQCPSGGLRLAARRGIMARTVQTTPPL